MTQTPPAPTQAEIRHKLFTTAIALKVANQHREWILPEPIAVRLSEMDYDIYFIYGLQVSPRNQVFVLAHDGNWHELEAHDTRGAKLVEAVHAKVFSTFKTK